MSKDLIIFREPKSPISEAFRTLRTNIQFMNMNKKLKTILVTSTLAGEGKSWITSNLAITFAQAGKKVIIIDADMRKGREYNIFQIAQRPGLSDYLAEVDENYEGITHLGDYIQKTDVENLYVMASGSVPPNPSELLISTQMVGLLNTLKESFDVVVIDGTPCDLVTDSVILSRIADSTVIVTEYNSTNKASLEKTVKSIQNVGGNIAGVVLNKVPINKRKYENSYYYGSKNSQHHSGREYRGRFEHDNLDIEIDNKNAVNTYNDETNNVQSKNTINTSLSKDEEALNILKQVNEYLDTEKKKKKQ